MLIRCLVLYFHTLYLVLVVVDIKLPAKKDSTQTGAPGAGTGDAGGQPCGC